LTHVLLANLLGHGVALGVAFLLVHRLANRVADFLVARFGNSLADRVLALLVAGLVDRLGLDAFHGLVARFRNRLVASLGFRMVNRLANRFHDRFLNGLVAGMPPFLQAAVVNELVAGPALLLAGAEATLSFAARLITVGVVGGAAMSGSGILDSPEQADQRSQQRLSQAQPHDLASSSA